MILGEQLEWVLLDRLLGRDVAGEQDMGEGPAAMGVMAVESLDCEDRLRSPRNSGAGGPAR